MRRTPTYAGGTAALATHAVVGEPTVTLARTFDPGVEVLRPDEIRVTILGSGSPWVTRAQAAGSVLMEVGNEARDVFVFDLGSGSLANFSGLKVPMTSLKKVFFSHLHADHIADYLALVGSYGKAGRLDPVEVWGGGAEEPSLGVAAFVEAIDRALAWNLASTRGSAPTSGMRVIPHEIPFDRGEAIYDRDGVTIRSFPVIHGRNGAVGYRLDYAGLSVVFSGDTTPSWTVVEAARGCDLLIHDTALPVRAFAELMSYSLEQAERIVHHGHSTPRAAGIVFDLVGPRMAAMWHCHTIEGYIEPVFEDLARSYGGPSVLCQDLTVFNVTTDAVQARQAVVDPVSQKVMGSNETAPHLDERDPPPPWWKDAAIDWRSAFAAQDEG